MNEMDLIVVGCGNSGLLSLNKILKDNPEAEVLGLEATLKIGGATSLSSRLMPLQSMLPDFYKVRETLKAPLIWWERQWTSPADVEWENKDWAFVIPQWKLYFQELKYVEFDTESLNALSQKIKLESPVAQISKEDDKWVVHSGEKTYSASKLVWSLGLKALNACYGKKESEAFMCPNSNFVAEATEAESLLSLDFSYKGDLKFSSEEVGSSFVAVPVRHDQKLYLCFVYVSATSLETFTFLPSDFVKQPKDVSSFEKSIKRTLKHVLGETLDLSTQYIALMDDGRSLAMSSRWSLESSESEKITFVGDFSSAADSKKTIQAELSL